MKPSSSASQSSMNDEQRGELSLDELSPDDILRCNDGGFLVFDLRIAVRKYFIGTRESPPCFLTSNGPPQNDGMRATMLSYLAFCSKRIMIDYDLIMIEFYRNKIMGQRTA